VYDSLALLIFVAIVCCKINTPCT